jgi:hypothetical protein
VTQVTPEAPATPMFIAALFTIAKLWKQPRCPTTDEWIKDSLLSTFSFHGSNKNGHQELKALIPSLQQPQ